MAMSFQRTGLLVDRLTKTMTEKKPTLDYGRHTRQSGFESKRHAIDKALVLGAIIAVILVLILFGSAIFTGY